MTDIVASVFQLTNRRYQFVPKLEFGSQEVDTGFHWHITAGGSRAYTLRFGSGIGAKDADSIAKQNADSHFMIGRVQAALLLAGHGLFQAEAMGRIFLIDAQQTPDWFTQQNLLTAPADTASAAFYDWLKTLIRHTMLRRAAADAHAALSNPHEAGIFVYRGLEWLVVGEGRSWDDLATDLGMSKAQVRDFKKLTNVDFGVRHASKSGAKLRADSENAAVWVCALLDAMNATRARLEPGYKPSEPKQVAETVLAAMPTEAYG